MGLLSWSVTVYRRHKMLHSPNPQHGITNTSVHVMINNRPLLTEKKLHNQDFKIILVLFVENGINIIVISRPSHRKLHD